MTLFPATASAPVSRSVAGIACVVGGMALIAVQDVLIKTLIVDTSLWMLMAARGVMGALILLPLIAVLGAPHRVLSPHWGLHLARATLLTCAFASFYATFPFMGLAEVSAIFFCAPLIIALLAWLWLGERIGPHRGGALAVGFLGVLIALNPSGEAFRPLSLMPLIGAAFYATAQVLARRLGERDSTLTTGFSTVVFMGLVVLPIGALVSTLVPEVAQAHHLRWDWTLPGGRALAGIAALGVAGTVGLALVSRGYQIANASLVAPFDYTYLPLAILAGYGWWGERVDTPTLVGMTLIVAGGLYLGYREVRASRAR